MPKPEIGNKEMEKLRNQRDGYMRIIERTPRYLNEGRFLLNTVEL